jgi:hypothetical protein
MLFRLTRYGMIEENEDGRWRLRNELWRKWEEGRLALPAPEEEGSIDLAAQTEDGEASAIVEDELVEAFAPDDPETQSIPTEELEPADAQPAITPQS